MMMRIATLLPLALLAACSDQPSKEESVQIFAAATTALTSAQAKAVDQARSGQLTAPADLVIDFSGPCALGGSLAVHGTYAGSGDDEHAAFDLGAAFNGCREVTGTLDGDLQWTSEASSAGFSATLNGGLDWQGNNGSASCDFDLALAVNDLGVSYDGHLCGYDVKTELVLGH
jgi:hypothetical protein